MHLIHASIPGAFSVSPFPSTPTSLSPRTAPAPTWARCLCTSFRLTSYLSSTYTLRHTTAIPQPLCKSIRYALFSSRRRGTPSSLVARWECALQSGRGGTPSSRRRGTPSSTLERTLPTRNQRSLVSAILSRPKEPLARSRKKYSAHPQRSVSHRESARRQSRLSRLDARLSLSHAPRPGAASRFKQFYSVDRLLPHRHPHLAFLWNLHSRRAGRRRSHRHF